MSNILERTIGHQYFIFAVRVVLGSIFIFAAIEKIAQPEEFAKNISYYRLLPISVVNLFAIVLPWVELLAGLSLIAGLVTRGSSLVISSLLGLFIVAIAISIARGLDISCGCFGTTTARKVGWAVLAEDLLMLSGSLLLYFFPSTFLTVEAYIRNSLPPQASETRQ